MKRLSLSCLLITILAILNGCSKEDPAMITISEGSVEYFQNRLNFSSEGGSKTVQFSTNKNWEINVSESGMNVDWCTVTPKSGTAGDVTLTITVPENTSYDERNVILTLSAGDAMEKMRVSQKQSDAILLSSSLFEVPLEGGEIELEVKSNVNYQVEIPEQYRGWIHKGSKTRALESNNLSFVVDSNEDYDKRQGEIIITDCNTTEVVKIYQAGGGVLVLSQNEYNVPSDGGTIIVDLSSNFEYGFEIPNVDWLKLNNGTRGMSSHTLYFEVLPNESYESRSANISFYEISGEVRETITIYQTSKGSTLFSYDPYNEILSYREQIFEIKVSSGIDIDVVNDSNWISYTESISYGESYIKLFIKENNTFDKRSSKVILKHGSYEYKIDFVQYGVPIDLSSEGTANCYIVPLIDKYFSIDASVAGNDRSCRLLGGINASIVWEASNDYYSQSKFIDHLEYESESGRIIFHTTQTEGNALVALCDENGAFIWSWHLWLTDYNPNDDFITFSNGSILMDRYLGAFSEEGTGLCYQWGRKDPFAYRKYTSILPDETNGTIEYSVAHPNEFMGGYYDGINFWDWNHEHNSTWSSNKTVYDPCPPGWKVMDENCLPSLSSDIYVDEDNHCIIVGGAISTPQAKFGFTDAIGSPNGDMSWDSPSMWTNCGSHHFIGYTALYKYLDDNCFKDMYIGRSYGHCVRCQRE